MPISEGASMRGPEARAERPSHRVAVRGCIRRRADKRIVAVTKIANRKRLRPGARPKIRKSEIATTARSTGIRLRSCVRGFGAIGLSVGCTAGPLSEAALDHREYGHGTPVRRISVRLAIVRQPPSVVAEAVWQYGGGDAGRGVALVHDKRMPNRIADFVQAARSNSGELRRRGLVRACASNAAMKPGSSLRWRLSETDALR